MKRTPLARKVELVRKAPLKATTRENRLGVERNCEFCGDLFRAVQEHAGYTRRFCSTACSGHRHTAEARAADPPRDEVVRLYELEGLSDKALGEYYGHSYQWAFKLRQRLGIPGRSVAEKRAPKRVKTSHGYITVNRQYEHRVVAAQMLGRPLAPGEVVHHINGKKDDNRPSNLKVYDSAAEHMRSEHQPRGYTMKPKRQTIAWGCSVKGEQECRNCGRNAHHLHHANGLPLCEECHTGWHHGRVTIARDVFTDEEWEFLTGVDLTGQRIEAWLDDHYPPRNGDDRRPWLCGEAPPEPIQLALEDAA